MSTEHRHYFNQRASEWGLKGQNDRLIDALNEFGVKPDDSILDVGAGTGCLTQFLQEMVGDGGCAVAADISDKMLAAARRQLKSRQVLYLCTDACELAIVPDSFDKIICYSTFPHFNKPLRALSEFYRILKPLGKILIFHNCCSRHLNLYHSRLQSVVSFDKLPKSEQLMEMIRFCGFVEVRGVERPDLYWVEARKPVTDNSGDL
jgi:SAM-dependent methyltransferase